jgi:hypothetical protein
MVVEDDDIDAVPEEYERVGLETGCMLDRDMKDSCLEVYFHDMFSSRNIGGKVDCINAPFAIRTNFGGELDPRDVLDGGYGYVFTCSSHNRLTYEVFVTPLWMYDPAHTQHVIEYMVTWYKFIRPTLDAWVISSGGSEDMIIFHCNQVSSHDIFSAVRYGALGLSDILGYDIQACFSKFILDALEVGESLGYYHRDVGADGRVHITMRKVRLYYVSMK